MDYKKEISQILNNLDIGMSVDDIYMSIETPPNKEMGDFAFPCFRLAKQFRKSPAQISVELAEEINSDLFSEIKPVGPYINFFLDKNKFNEILLKKIFDKKEKFGSSDIGNGKNTIIEYSSTNIAKPFHIGHIRSTVIGDSLKRIYKFLGYNVIAINYLGDYGTQFGVLLAAYSKWGDKEQIDRDPIKELLKLYVRYNTEARENPEMMDEARAWFKKLEDKDEFAIETWKWFKEVSLKEFERVYNLLDIEFDSYNGEYYHSQFVNDVLKELEDKNLLVDSEGARVVEIEGDNPPAIITKSDGTSTYIVRDIATAIYRKKKYDFDENIYVVATQQNLHFKNLKEILSKMGYDWAEDCHHVQFGMVSLKDGALATRKGNVVFLEDVLNNAIKKTREIIEKRNPNLEDKDKVAREIGIGAVKFQELFNTRIKDYVFDMDQTLNFEGETGPYVQYAHARANQILEKLDLEITDDIDYSLLSTEQEAELIMSLYKVKDVILSAKEKLEPSIITRHVTEIAQNFNSFYNSVHIMNSKEEEKRARALLVYATKVCISNLLALLGIEAPNKM
ncbi:arginine--tRNA ligase [Helcococcus kunzii]|uniref:Arginine--tRNA ligase n=1 Tax=Helcococcus kunzii ATCC 51366 TaxID=883114 RepID=H3NMQ5_9FIRM|nr:arginine--tRNA ligase [Helcococcus kunzii]EHR34646.1 arginine-tRNA ligase [Helcococcus kunzii ATCC 51366]MCT1796696.1 arginine--tRNA ligase [Helcococcus kunzii]MCT1989100.1 arginine--tRNA ligase [Helcococcus kunzii]QUY64559.1 arginine--tRNA ligase [Helcococcus kunzii]QZO76972.1 arginine--tRNA ligase [Helcococcus kunzii]